jgi:hypothetical protein
MSSARIWFNASTTEAGRDALGYYHERKDENRDIGLGPEHDWSSHAADAFGLMGDRLRRAIQVGRHCIARLSIR